MFVCIDWRPAPLPARKFLPPPLPRRMFGGYASIWDGKQAWCRLRPCQIAERIPSRPDKCNRASRQRIRAQLPWPQDGHSRRRRTRVAGRGTCRERKPLETMPLSAWLQSSDAPREAVRNGARRSCSGVLPAGPPDATAVSLFACAPKQRNFRRLSGSICNEAQGGIKKSPLEDSF